MKTVIFAIALIAASSVTAWQPYQPGINSQPAPATSYLYKAPVRPQIRRQTTITSTPFGNGQIYRDGNHNVLGTSSQFGNGMIYRDSKHNVIGKSHRNINGGTTWKLK